MDDVNDKLLKTLIQRQKQDLMKTLNKYGTLHPTFGREHIPEQITPEKLAEVDDLAEKLAKGSLQSDLLEAQKEHPRFGSTEETVRVERPNKTNLATQLDDIGAQGSILKQKLLEAGIDPDKIKNTSELKPTRSEPYIIPPEERARIIDVGALKKAEANKIALQRLGKAAKIGGVGIGALATTKDIEEGNIPEAGIDIAETGLSLGGKLAGRAAPFLELLRSTPTQTEEQEESELAKYRKLNNMLVNSKKEKSRSPASEE